MKIISAVALLACIPRALSGQDARLGIPYEFTCTIARQNGQEACVRDPRRDPVRAALHPIGNRGAYIAVGVTHINADSAAGTLAFDLTVQNLLRQTLTGSKVLLAVRCDGPCSLTQGVMEYDRVLQPQQVSAPRRWGIRLCMGCTYARFDVTVDAAFPAAGSTPATSPSTVPDSLFDDKNVNATDPQLTIAFIRNCLAVSFPFSTSQPDRALAMAKVGGTVVGGWREMVTDGTYMIRVPGDTSGREMQASMATLDSLAQIEYANPVLVSSNANDTSEHRP